MALSIKNLDHFYTSNDEEKDKILKDPIYGNGYYWNKYKGVVLYLWSSNVSFLLKNKFKKF